MVYGLSRLLQLRYSTPKCFPNRDIKHNQRSPPVDAEPQPDEQRILLVEDERFAVGYISEALNRKGYVCDAVTSCAEALQTFSRGRYACALVDLGLPDGDGSELLARLGEEDPNLVQIVMTGSLGAGSVVSSMRAGAFDYLMKPVDLMTLTRSVARAISHHAVLVERGELFRLLYEEREQLRDRVEAATTDIRKYAVACETNNARLQTLLDLTQSSGDHAATQDFLKILVDGISQHLPLRAVVLGDTADGRAMLCRAPSDAEPSCEVFEMQPGDRAPALIESEPLTLARNWVRRTTEIDVDHPAVMVYPQRIWGQPTGLISFFFERGFVPDAFDCEFIDMCAYLLAIEWERGKLLVHAARRAGLGDIAAELVQNVAEPVAAMVAAAVAIAASDGCSDHAQTLQTHLGRLQQLIHSFDHMSAVRADDEPDSIELRDCVSQALDILREAVERRGVSVTADIDAPCVCTVHNPGACTRTLVDLMLATLQAMDPGDALRVTLQPVDDERAALEIRHDAPANRAAPAAEPTAGDKGAWLALRLAESAIAECGGALSVSFDDSRRRTLRITVPCKTT